MLIKDNKTNQKGFLTVSELKFAHNQLITGFQKSTFKSEIDCLLSDKSLPAKHKFACMAPFIDKDGLLRVGGRVSNHATIAFDQKHPCLYSRPLCKMSGEDADVLTPANFLLNRTMTAVPDEDVAQTNISLLNRYRYLQRLVQQFCKKWSLEYISQLQNRPKWNHFFKVHLSSFTFKYKREVSRT